MAHGIITWPKDPQSIVAISNEHLPYDATHDANTQPMNQSHDKSICGPSNWLPRPALDKYLSTAYIIALVSSLDNMRMLCTIPNRGMHCVALQLLPVTSLCRGSIELISLLHLPIAPGLCRSKFWNSMLLQVQVLKLQCEQYYSLSCMQ